MPPGSLIQNVRITMVTMMMVKTINQRPTFTDWLQYTELCLTLSMNYLKGPSKFTKDVCEQGDLERETEYCIYVSREKRAIGSKEMGKLRKWLLGSDTS